MAFKNGDKVRQVPAALVTGTVVGFALDQEEGQVHVKVEWVDANGDTQSRHFDQDEVELVPVV
jgi:hypothetical protein